MSLWRQITYGLRWLTNRPGVDREIDDEARHYMDEAAAAFEARGMSPEEARRAARMEMGSAIGVREQVRDHGWESGIAATIDTLRHAARRLVRNPTFSATAVLTLGLGIGASATIFAVIDSVLLRPLPYPEPNRLIALRHSAPGIGIPDLRMSPSLYYTYKEEGRVFQDLAIWQGGRVTVTGMGEPEELPSLYATHEFLQVLEVVPVIGRGFVLADQERKGAPVVMLSNAYWQQQFGGARSVLGQRIVVDGNAHEVIGVMPDSDFLDRKYSLVFPMVMNRGEVRLIQFREDGVARLKPGVTLEQASADVARCILLAPSKFALNSGFAANSFTDARITPSLRTLRDSVVGEIGRTLWVLMGAVGILLLIACANVANLLLVRADARQQELAVRSALGAGWGRIARELLAESLLLGIGGGAIGLGLCYAALQWVAASAIPQLPRLSTISMSGVTVAFAFCTAVLLSLLFGLIPVLKYARPRIADGLRGGGRSMSQSQERHRVRGALVVAQVALSMVLLVSSGLMIRTFLAMRAVDPGFSHPENVQVVRVSIPHTQVAEALQVFQTQEAILRRFETIPGVTSVGISTAPPMDGGNSEPIFVADHDYGEGRIPPVRRHRSISPGYLSASGTRLVAGREFSWSDLHRGLPMAMISENMARELWGDPSAAIGKRIRGSANQVWREVIGVAGDIRDVGVNQNAPAIVYWPLVQKGADGTYGARRNADILVRTPRAGTTDLVRELKQALALVNPNLPLAEVRTLQDIYERTMARTAFALVLMGVAGGMALLLGIVGIYGVIAYSVSQRVRDIGIRIALGSPQHGVTRLFVREGLMLTGIGAACGIAVALGVTRLMDAMLFGVGPNDPLTFAAVFAGLAAAAMAASWLPARRAAAVDPIVALRSE